MKHSDGSVKVAGRLASTAGLPSIYRIFYYPPTTFPWLACLLITEPNLVLDFEVQKFTRVCAKTERELKAGDQFFSYLVRDGGDTVRRDVIASAWEGPPDDCLGWWKSEVPDPKSKKLNWAPHDVMLHYFTETEGNPEENDVRYILALLMIRRRILRLEETATNADGQEVMALFCSRNETEYEVPVVEVSAERAAEVQALLSELLVDTGK